MPARSKVLRSRSPITRKGGCWAYAIGCVGLLALAREVPRERKGGGHQIHSRTVIATTGGRFSDFMPYVASVNDAGIVAFQATLQGSGTGVFLGSGGPVAQVAGLISLAGVTSHPDLNGAGAISFYGTLAGGGQGVFLHRDGRLQPVADSRGAFVSIGPAGPTMNEAGVVAFRADRLPGVSGIFVGDGASTAMVADTQGRWSQFYGLPVINNSGTVVFRADRSDGLQGIYLSLIHI